MTAITLLKKKAFVSVATCDFKGQPNAAPKIVLDADNRYIYLVDYTAGKTWENLKINPLVSLSFSDTDELKCYKINGKAEIIENGPLYEEMAQKLEDRKLTLSVERVIEGVKQHKKHAQFELAISNQFVIFKITVQEITEISPRGELLRNTIPAQ